MKININILLTILLTLVASNSCTKDTSANMQSHRDIYFKATVDDATKATLTEQTDGSFKGGWEDGDELTIHKVNGTTVEYATWDSDKKAFYASSTLEAANIYAYFPEGTYESSDIHFTFPAEREQIGNVINGIYDIMYSKKVTIESGQKLIPINMIRATAIQYFKFTTSDENVKDEKIVSATLTVEGDNAFIAASDYATVQSGKLVANTGVKSITLTFPSTNSVSAPTAGDFQLWFNVCPVSYESMTLNVKTENHEFTITNSTGGTYSPGNLYRVAMTPTWARSILNCSDISNTSYSENETTFFHNNKYFGYKNIKKNINNNPKGWAHFQVMQVKSNGTIYNTSSIAINSIRVYTVGDSYFTIAYGTSTTCESDTYKRPTTPTGTKEISYTKYESEDESTTGKISLNYYELKNIEANYFKLTNGSSTNYIYQIVIN